MSLLDRRNVLLGGLTAVGGGLGGCATAPMESSSLRAVLADAVGAREGAGMVAVVIDGRKTTIASHGNTGVPGLALDGRTVFEIMSITKVLTSLLLADMAGRGEVGLDDPLQTYLPQGITLKAKGRPVTLLDLATYRSSLPNMPGNLPRDWYARPDPLGDYTEDKLLAFLSAYTPDQAPGERYRYANLAFGLLGNALAQRAGKPYETLLIDRICRPLGLDHTRITLTRDMQRHLVRGHDLDGKPVSLWNFPALPGAGTVRSSAQDLTVLLKACLGLKRTPLDAALKQLPEIRRPTPAPDTQAGMGWYITASQGGEIIWKSGLSGGCNTFIGYSPQSGRGAVLLSNFLWRPLDEGTINMGIHLIDPLAPSRPFGSLNAA